MPAIWLPGGQSMEPADPDLVELIVPAGASLIDLISGTIGTHTAGTQPAQIATSHGPALRFMSGAVVRMPRHVYPWDLDGPTTERAQTIVLLARVVENPTAWQDIARAYAASAGTLGVRRAGTSGRYQAHAEAGGGGVGFIEVSGITDGSVISASMSVAPGRWAGQLNGTGNEGSHTRSWGNPTTQTEFGASVSFDLLLFARINRYVGLAEQNDMARDGWRGLFARRKRPLYFDAGGGGGGVVIDTVVGDAEAFGAPAGIIASTIIAAQVGGAAAAGLPAAVQHAVAIPATVGDAAAAGSPAAISQGTTVAAGIGNAEASGLPASLSTGSTIDAAVGDAQAAGLTAGISAATAIAATRGDAEASGLPAAISQGVVIVAGVGGASASGRPANIAQVITITTTAGNAAAAGLTAAIEAAGGEIACLVGDAEARGLVAGIAAGVTVRASVGGALASGLAAHLVAAAAIQCDIGIAVAAGLPCSIGLPALTPTPGYIITRAPRAWRVTRAARTWRITS